MRIFLTTLSFCSAFVGCASMRVARQNPIVGSDIATHRSGIHSDGILKGGFELYTPHDPRFWGHKHAAKHEDGMYQGKGGRAAVKTI